MQSGTLANAQLAYFKTKEGLTILKLLKPDSKWGHDLIYTVPNITVQLGNLSQNGGNVSVEYLPNGHKTF